MEEKLCSGNEGKVDATVEQDFFAALLSSEGISFIQTISEASDERVVTVAEDPKAKIAYPWNPLMPEAEAYFVESDLPSIFDGWQEEEIVSRSRSFFAGIDHLWSTVSLQATLVERFAARVPQNWLVAIAQQAQKVVADTQKAVSEASSTLADQLVQCVREVAPSLTEEDFYVLARPLAVQMRNGGMTSTVDAFIAQVPQVEWDQLSEVQKARLGLAIARYALSELQTSQST
ncbi:hypothetical protein OsccyDRAFT_1874 [Leptolyngbyaceae cyanobacterium JSC-12]|nr:hypothetical protein OsccyDRAFT_1874 [Leptolyngbyaceae cyanobacterium JSC-12]